MINILEYNCIFRYYLLFLLIFNIFTTYTFFIYRFYNNEKKNLLNYQDDYFEDNKNTHITHIFYYKLKKINRIISNPVKFNYQINQLVRIKNNQKYNEYKNNILNIKSNMSIYKIYTKIIKRLKKKYKMSNNKIDKIILHLLCINF